MIAFNDTFCKSDMELLRDFGVNNTDINKLIENNITLQVLKLMTDGDFKRYNLDISIGSKILIEKFLKIQFKQDNNDHFFNLDDIPIVTLCDEKDDSQRKRVSDSDEISPNPKKHCTNTEIILQNENLISTSLYLSDYSLNRETIEELLLENLEGQAVLAKFQNHLRLEDRDRSTMVSILINRCKVADIRKPLEFCNRLSDLIVEIFPTESKDIYYIEPLSDGNKTKNAKGKVPDKWRNVMFHLRSAGVLKKKSATKKSVVSEKSTVGTIILPHVKQEKETSIDDNVQWLQTNRNWEDVQAHWEITREYRQKRIKALSKNDFLIEWPILKSDLAPRLIFLDFDKLYPGRESRITTHWCQLFADLYSLKKKCIFKPDSKKLCEIYDSNLLKPNIDLDALRLFLLPFLLPSKSKVKSNGVISIPTATEAQNGLIIQVKSQESLMSDIQERQKLCKERNCPPQPFIVVVSPDLITISNIYVSLDDQLWSLPSTIKALDFTFQLHFVFNIEFPHECYHVWLLLQKMLYDIHLPKIDQKIPIITRVISDLNILNASRVPLNTIKMEI